jgi:hypothetical protein
MLPYGGFEHVFEATTLNNFMHIIHHLYSSIIDEKPLTCTCI